MLHTILCPVLVVFLIVLVLRAVLSWFPVQPGTGLARVNSILFDLTDWILRPMRQIIRPVGMFDVSFMVLFFVVFLLWRAIC